MNDSIYKSTLVLIKDKPSHIQYPYCFFVYTNEGTQFIKLFHSSDLYKWAKTKNAIINDSHINERVNINILPFRISFKNKEDAAEFKLLWNNREIDFKLS